MYDYLEVGTFRLSSRLGKERKYVPKDMDTRVPVYLTRLKSKKKGSKARLIYFAFFPVDPQVNIVYVLANIYHCGSCKDVVCVHVIAGGKAVCTQAMD